MRRSSSTTKNSGTIQLDLRRESQAFSSSSTTRSNVDHRSDGSTGTIRPGHGQGEGLHAHRHDQVRPTENRRSASVRYTKGPEEEDSASGSSVSRDRVHSQGDASRQGAGGVGGGGHSSGGPRSRERSSSSGSERRSKKVRSPTIDLHEAFRGGFSSNVNKYNNPHVESSGPGGGPGTGSRSVAPEVTSFEVDKSYPRVPIVLVTSRKDREESQRAAASGGSESGKDDEKHQSSSSSSKGGGSQGGNRGRNKHANERGSPQSDKTENTGGRGDGDGEREGTIVAWKGAKDGSGDAKRERDVKDGKTASFKTPDRTRGRTHSRRWSDGDIAKRSNDRSGLSPASQRPRTGGRSRVRERQGRRHVRSSSRGSVSSRYSVSSLQKVDEVSEEDSSRSPEVSRSRAQRAADLEAAARMRPSLSSDEDNASTASGHSAPSEIARLSATSGSVGRAYRGSDQFSRDDDNSSKGSSCNGIAARRANGALNGSASNEKSGADSKGRTRPLDRGGIPPMVGTTSAHMSAMDSAAASHGLHGIDDRPPVGATHNSATSLGGQGSRLGSRVPSASSHTPGRTARGSGGRVSVDGTPSRKGWREQAKIRRALVLAAAQTAHNKATERQLAQSAAKSSTGRTATASSLSLDESRNKSGDRGPAGFSGHRASTAVMGVDVDVHAELSKDGGSGDIDRCNDTSTGGIGISDGIGGSKDRTTDGWDTAGRDDETPPNSHRHLAQAATSLSSTPYASNGRSDDLHRNFAPLMTSTVDSEPHHRGSGGQQGTVDRQNGLCPVNASIQPEVEVTAGGDLKLVQGRAQTESQADVGDAERDEPELAPRGIPALRARGRFAASSVGEIVSAGGGSFVADGGVPGGVGSSEMADNEYGNIKSVTGSDSASLVVIEAVSPSNVVTGSDGTALIAGSRSDNTRDTDALAVNAATNDGGGTDNEGEGAGVDEGPEVCGCPKNKEGGAVDNVPLSGVPITASEVFAEDYIGGRVDRAKRGGAGAAKGDSAATLANTAAATRGWFRTAEPEVGDSKYYVQCDMMYSKRERRARYEKGLHLAATLARHAKTVGGGALGYESQERCAGQPAAECQVCPSRFPYYIQPPSGDSASPAGEPSAETSSRRLQHQERKTPQPRGHILTHRSRRSSNDASSMLSSSGPQGHSVPSLIDRAAAQRAANGGRAWENAGKILATRPQKYPGRTVAHARAPGSPASLRSRSTGSKRSSRSGRGSMKKVAEEAWGIYGFLTPGEDRSRGSVDDPKVLDIAEAHSASSRSTASSRKTRHEEPYDSDSLSDQSFTKLFEEFEGRLQNGSRSQRDGSKYDAWGRPEDWASDRTANDSRSRSTNR